MSVDPAARLSALSIDDAEEAISVRFPPEERTRLKGLGLSDNPWKLIEDAVSDFAEHVDEAIRFEQSEISLSVEIAELIAIALKTRKRPASRPKHTKDQQRRRNALAALGRQLKAEYRKTGMTACVAEEEAAKSVAEIGRRSGDIASWQTMQKLIRSRPKKPG